MSRPKLGSLFSGVGGLDLAVEAFFGAETVWHVEYDMEPSKVLAAHWPGIPNHGDITLVDWSKVEPVDIICGGFPCQDLSLAGRRAGMRPGTRSGLWADFLKAIDALNPKVVIVENVRGLLSGCAESDSDLEPCPGCVGDGQHRPLVRALGRVLGDLATLGFDAEWGALEASSVGAPHGRFRVFVVAFARGVRLGSGCPAESREASVGRASAVDRRRSGASLTLLPTPSANEFDGNPEPFLARAAAWKEQYGNGTGMPLSIAIQLLPTPTTDPETGNGHARNLGKEIKLLPTPQSVDSSGGRYNSPGHQETLPGTVRTLPTPRASRGASSTEIMYALGGERDDEGDRQGNVTGPVSWGPYAPAVERWEALTRPAPAPTRPDGKNGRHRLNPGLPEWMQGYPAGWITDFIGRDPAIKAAGNSVCPQQAYEAIRQLWERAIVSSSPIRGDEQ